ncbi:unnamed protein product [Rotaria sp. Silwood1]|nr:unnamed protein product [Rotaria sp. Silwood1]CAF4738714.1 unnamed protein product [Rotaria sp. Silwood1]CAF5014323.1 unnamed protein product [Rotaria sp. Silwood1]
MVITRAHYQQLFQQEAKRLSDIDIEFSPYSEFSLNHIVYHPAFLSVMEEQMKKKIQLTLNELRHASINSPDTYPTDDDDPIDGIVSLVKRSTNPYTRSSNWQPPSSSPQPLMN